MVSTGLLSTVLNNKPSKMNYPEWNHPFLRLKLDALRTILLCLTGFLLEIVALKPTMYTQCINPSKQPATSTSTRKCCVSIPLV